MAHAPRIVILGGGFGGINTAVRLTRRLRGAADIVLVSSSPVHTFTPWLYEVASASARTTSSVLSASADVPIDAFLPSARKIRFRHATVENFDLAHKHVVLQGGHTLRYDILVLALGADVAYFDIPGLRACALSFKTTEDAIAIHRRLRELFAEITRGERTSLEVRIGGAGPSGVELAAELATMTKGMVQRGELPIGAARITLIDGAPRVLGMLPPSASRIAEQRLLHLGVNVMLDTVITEAHAADVVVRSRPRNHKTDMLSQSPFPAPAHLPSDLTVWTGGVTPNSILEKCALPKDLRGRIVVTPSFAVEGHPHIFALGDAALLVAPASRQPMPQTAQAAEFASSHVAKNIARLLAGKSPRRARLPASWPFVVAIGARYAVASIYGIVVAGRIAYTVRRAADLRYFLRMLPCTQALRTWWHGVALYAKNDS